MRPAVRALGLLALLASSMSAQQVELLVREEGSRAAVGGAIVRLLGEQGVASQGLTSEAGRVTLRAPPGVYRIKVDRIGWRGMITAPVTLTEGQTLRSEIAMASARQDLPTLEVRGSSRCDREGQGGALAAALWDEIGKALTANILTQRQRAVPLHVRGFIRELDVKSNFLRQWVVSSTLTRGQPFASLSPAGLARHGFVVAEKHDSFTYAAPDAALLLSDEFVRTHCFRVTPGAEGLVGLAFEPVSGRRVVEVTGTMWVDRATSELKHLDYRYTGLPGLLDKADLGGRLEFQRLPGGAWIVSSWHVRTPRLDEVEVRGTGNVRGKLARLLGYVDVGGNVTIAGDHPGRVDRALILGEVHDSIAGTGLAGAVVAVDGTRDSVRTDAQGRYTLAVAASGDQVLRVTHPKLAVLPGPAARRVLLSLGDTARASFALPSLATLVRDHCGNPKNRAGIVGLAAGADGGPPDRLEVQVSWRTPGGGLKEERRRPGRNGVFALCELPADQTLPVRLVDGKRPLLEQPIRLEWGKFSWVELRAETLP